MITEHEVLSHMVGSLVDPIVIDDHYIWIANTSIDGSSNDCTLIITFENGQEFFIKITELEE